MNTHTEIALVATQPCGDAPTHIPAAEWRPEPCGLSREEMREIVAEMLG